VLRTRWNCAGHDSIEGRLSVRIDQIGGEESVFAPLRIKVPSVLTSRRKVVSYHFLDRTSLR
jgi:hypothetical protein